MAGLVAGGAVLAAVPPTLAQQATLPKTQGVQQAAPQGTPQNLRQNGNQDIVRRLNELEALVNQARAEMEKLRKDLDVPMTGEQGGTARAGNAAGAGAVVSGPAVPAKVAQQAPASKKATADEWAEPEVEKKQTGRDEEARRRLRELEAQMRKVTAEATKQEEEKKSKVAFDFSGKYKLQFNNRNNFNLNNPQQQGEFDNATFFDHRFQLKIEGSYEKFLARFLLDKGNFVFDWKEDSEGTLERWGEFQTVNAALVRELFVQYTGDFVTRIGRQNWQVGNAITLEGPIDSIRVDYPLGTLPWGRTTVTGGYMAIAGGWKSFTDFRKTGPPEGDRQELFSAKNKLDAYYLGFDVRPSSTLQIQPYALKAIDRGDAGDADLNLDKDFDATTTVRDGHFEPLWTGVRATFNVDKLRLDGEAVYQSGEFSRTRDISAYAFLLKGRQDFGKVSLFDSLSLELEFGLGSGNGTSDSTTGTVRDFNGLFLCKPRHKYGNIFSEDIRAGYFLWDSNLSNITYARLGATLEPLKGLKFTPSFAKIWTTEDVFEGRGPIGDWSRGRATSTRKTNDVGWEIDLDVSYPVLKYLDAYLNIGYFQPGAVYARPNRTTADAAFEVVLGSELKF